MTPELRAEAMKVLAPLKVPFTDDQLEAITAPLAPGVVIAGAGSGKTSVMAARVVWLVASKAVRPEEVLGLTFTRKAASELRERLRRALDVASPRDAFRPEDEAVDEPMISTYHAYAGRLLREQGTRLGIEPDARLLTDAQRFQLAERVLRRSSLPLTRQTGGLTNVAEAVIALDAEMSEHLVDPTALLEHDAAVIESIEELVKPTLAVKKIADAAAQRRELVDVVVALRAEKARLSVLDFGDQIAFTARLTHEFPQVGQAERATYKVVLLDEYQDTSVAQKQLLNDLFGGGHPVTAVGDPLQAIYGWRGASVGNIGRFHEEFLQADGSPAHQYGLAQNNRSGGQVLAVANELARSLRDENHRVTELTPRPDVATAGHTRIGWFDTCDDELAWSADQVAEAVAAGTSPREIAVLVKERSDVPAWHAALSARGIPVEVVGVEGLLDVPAVADLVAMLTVLDDPTANPSMIRLLTGSRWRLGAHDLQALGQRAAHIAHVGRGRAEADDDAAQRLGRSLDEAVAGSDASEVAAILDAVEDPGPALLTADAHMRLEKLSAELAELRRWTAAPLADLVHRAVVLTGLDVESQVGAARDAGAAVALNAFLDLVSDFSDVEGDGGLHAFLLYLRAAVARERGIDHSSPSAVDSVKLMTIHKAKGLEWDVVVLSRFCEGVMPDITLRGSWHSSSRVLPFALRGDAADFPTITDLSTKGLEEFTQALKARAAVEERRLAYVAVTRPRSLLIVSGHRWGRTKELKPRKDAWEPSQFLAELKSLEASGAVSTHAWVATEDGATNPLAGSPTAYVWPVALDADALERRRAAAHAVEVAIAAQRASASADAIESLVAAIDPDDRAPYEQLCADVERLVEEYRAGHVDVIDVERPAALSASDIVNLSADPERFARSLVRPMPRPPARAASRGTRFHAWVERRFDQHPLVDTDDLVGTAEADWLVDDADLASLQESFENGPYANREPLAIEAGFQILLAGTVIRGRIDAVYGNDDGSYEVVDWKTGRTSADPLQLAIYRLAWSEISGVEPERVHASFYYVADGRTERPTLPDRAAVELLLTAPPSPVDVDA